MSTLTIVKIGGNIIDDAQQLQAFLRDFTALDGDKILVHGGGSIASSIGKRLGIESHYVDGRRITDEATLELVTMVYGGLINKRIVTALQALGCNAMGLTGADGNSITAKRRPIGATDYGFVGDVHTEGVNAAFVATLLQSRITPIFAPLTHDGKGSLLNTNADTIAQELAKALASETETTLIYCFEKGGVLRDPEDEDSVIPVIDAGTFAELQDADIVTAGMIPKLSNAFAALKAGVHSVIIGHAGELTALIKKEKGTQIV